MAIIDEDDANIDKARNDFLDAANELIETIAKIRVNSNGGETSLGDAELVREKKLFETKKICYRKKCRIYLGLIDDSQTEQSLFNEICMSTDREISTVQELMKHHALVSKKEGTSLGGDDQSNKPSHSDNNKNSSGSGMSKTDTAVVGTSAAAAATSVPWLIGFTNSGVAAGSLAATIQSGIGSVVAGSSFATMQTIGATTLLGTGVGLGIGAAIGVTYGAIKLVKHVSGKSQEEDTASSSNQGTEKKLDA